MIPLIKLGLSSIELAVFEDCLRQGFVKAGVPKASPSGAGVLSGFGVSEEWGRGFGASL